MTTADKLLAEVLANWDDPNPHPDTVCTLMERVREYLAGIEVMEGDDVQ